MVAKRSSRLPSLAGRVRYEPELPEHPLCGVVRGLEYARERGAGAAVLIACDMPLVTPGLLRWLAELPGAAMVQLQGRPQPALARVRCSQLPELREALLSRAVADGRDRGARTADRGRARPAGLRRAGGAVLQRQPPRGSGARRATARPPRPRGGRPGPARRPGLRPARAAIQHEIGAAVRSDAWAAMPASASSCWTSSSVGTLDAGLGGEGRDPFRAVHGARAYRRDRAPRSRACRSISSSRRQLAAHPDVLDPGLLEGLGFDGEAGALVDARWPASVPPGVHGCSLRAAARSTAICSIREATPRRRKLRRTATRPTFAVSPVAQQPQRPDHLAGAARRRPRGAGRAASRPSSSSSRGTPCSSQKTSSRRAKAACQQGLLLGPADAGSRRRATS